MDHFEKALNGWPMRSGPTPKPKLIIDADSKLVALAHPGIFVFGPMRYYMHRYVDGTEHGIKLMFEALPYLAKEAGCNGSGGYIPTLPWFIQILEDNEDWKRGTETEQWEFHWKNVDYV